MGGDGLSRLRPGASRFLSPPPPADTPISQGIGSRAHATPMAEKHGQPLPHLRPGEVTLLEYAADDTRDVLSLSDKEALLLQLAHQTQEQRLEKALLEQGTPRVGTFCFFLYLLLLFPLFASALVSDISPEPESLSGDNVEEALVVAEREFLEARATYTVRRKATRTILMTDPILKAVHLKASTPSERYATFARV